MLQEQSAALARQRRQATRTSPSTGVSPEFLAALPAHIQEEVLAQVSLQLFPIVIPLSDDHEINSEVFKMSDLTTRHNYL